MQNYNEKRGKEKERKNLKEKTYSIVAITVVDIVSLRNHSILRYI